MPVEETHASPPRLYGAPAYMRPRSAVAPTPRPLHPDDLPIAIGQTPEEQRLAEELLDRPYQTVVPAAPAREEPRLEARRLLLRETVGRTLRPAS
jgi:hypothetical protein